MKRRPDEFVVGYEGEGECIWGCESSDGALRWAQPVKAQRAIRMAKRRQGEDRKTIYRLVRVPLAEVEAQAARERKARKGGRR